METTEKRPQTIGEWLDWAEEQGYEWAKEAREETIRLSGLKSLEFIVPSLKKAVMHMFAWHESDRGFNDWDEIYESFPND